MPKMSVYFGSERVASRTHATLFQYVVLMVHTDASVTTWVTKQLIAWCQKLAELEKATELHPKIRALRIATAHDEIRKLRMIRPGDPHKVLVWARGIKTAESACIPKTLKDDGFEFRVVPVFVDGCLSLS